MKRYEKYKDSKVAWLGQIPEHWHELFLFQCAEESKASNKGLVNQNLLSLSYGNIIRKRIDATTGLLPASFETYQIVDEGNIVMRLTDLQNDKRSLRTGLVKEKGIITSAYVCLKCKLNVLPKYFHYLLHSFDISKLFYSLGGGLRQGCNYSDLKKVVITIPSPDEQEQIVRYLDWKVAMADKFVREKRHQVELLKEQIEALCYGGSNNEYTVITQWCPNLPSHWKSVLAKRIFAERKIKNCSEEEMLAVTQDRGVVFKKDCSQNYVTAENTSTQKLVKRDDFVISLRSFQGGIEYSKVQGIVSPAYNVFYLKEKYNSPELQAYYRFLFKSKAFIALLFSMGGGIRDGKNISFSDFSQIELPLPSKDISEEILRLSQIYDSLSAYLPQTIKFINEFKTSLISDVTTGKVDVRGIEIPDYEKEEPTAIEDDNEDNNE